MWGKMKDFFKIFAFPSRFFLFFPISPDFYPLFPSFSFFFPIFGKIFAVRGGTLPPCPPPLLSYCNASYCIVKKTFLTKYTLINVWFLFGVCPDQLNHSGYVYTKRVVGNITALPRAPRGGTRLWLGRGCAARTSGP